MPRPRKELVCTGDTRFYHCVSRCVRRAFLCGRDFNSGQSYEHRRQWIVDRIHNLSRLFEVDVCSYAVMSNHYHLVVRLGDSDQLTFEDVIQRWLQLYKGPLLAHSYLAGKSLTDPEMATLIDTVAVWRQRLGDLSWFMKCLNEPIARQANREDQCTGHFWEARFRSQALKSEESLLSCMVYVDLNPIRAGIASKPEDSDYTSAQERISSESETERASGQESANLKPTKQKPHSGSATHSELLPFKGARSVSKCDQGKVLLPFSWQDYLELLDWTGRQRPPDKRGSIDQSLPSILTRMKIDRSSWIVSSRRYKSPALAAMA